MIICKLTGATGKGVKAHIVPKAFYEISSQDDGPHILLSNTKGTYPKKLPVGIYDQTMVTKEGENRFQDWDNYAARILIKEANKLEEVIDSGKLRGWKLPEYDYSSLKLFALSVLWRSHASTNPAFAKVDLGPHEAHIRKMLLNGDPGDSELYSVNIIRWKSTDFDPVFMDPFREKHGEGVNYYRVYCGQYVISVKVDKRPTIPMFQKFQLGATKELFLMARELKKSKEFHVMQKIVKHNLDKKTPRAQTQHD